MGEERWDRKEVGVGGIEERKRTERGREEHGRRVVAFLLTAVVIMAGISRALPY